MCDYNVCYKIWLPFIYFRKLHTKRGPVTLLLKQYLLLCYNGKTFLCREINLRDGVALNELWWLHWGVCECMEILARVKKRIQGYDRYHRTDWSDWSGLKVLSVVQGFCAGKIETVSYDTLFVSMFIVNIKRLENLGSVIPLMIGRIVRTTQNSVFTCDV
jgi:hypothetical protein